MSPRYSLRAAVFAGWLLASTSAAAARQDERPNVLFLFADDQRPDTIHALGNPHIETPSLDRLVTEGFHFTANHCMGSRHGAVCAPSRAMLMSGRTLHRVKDNLQGVVTLGQVLGAAGYATFGTGKWHNGKDSFKRSFQAGQRIMFGGMSDHWAVPLEDMLADGTGFENKRKGEGSSSELFAGAAVSFLEAHAAAEDDRPFFCYVSFTAPHDPRDPPQALRERYYAEELPLPPNFLPQYPWCFDLPTLTLRDEVLAAWPRDPQVVRDQLADYYGLITHMDTQLGRVLDCLDRLELAENTLVVFSADHGLAVGSHGLLGKQNLYEHSMGCPLVLRGPGVPAGRGSDALTYLLDLYPTLCAVSGAEVPEGVEGKDLMPVVHGDVMKVRDSLFTLYRDSQRAVRDGRWKLIRYPKIDVTLLFDLQEDPHEMENLAADPGLAERLAGMTALLKSWQEATEDTLPWTAEEVGPQRVDLTGRKRKPDRHQPEWIRRKYFGE